MADEAKAKLFDWKYKTTWAVYIGRTCVDKPAMMKDRPISNVMMMKPRCRICNMILEPQNLSEMVLTTQMFGGSTVDFFHPLHAQSLRSTFLVPSDNCFVLNGWELPSKSSRRRCFIESASGIFRVACAGSWKFRLQKSWAHPWIAGANSGASILYTPEDRLGLPQPHKRLGSPHPDRQ